jgi:hypothetical protein
MVSLVLRLLTHLKINKSEQGKTKEAATGTRTHSVMLEISIVRDYPIAPRGHFNKHNDMFCLL